MARTFSGVRGIEHMYFQEEVQKFSTVVAHEYLFDAQYW